MPEHQILLNGADEGINVIVTSSVNGAESPNLVLKSIQTIFPEFDCEIPDEEAEKITTVKQANDYVNANVSN